MNESPFSLPERSTFAHSNIYQVGFGYKFLMVLIMQQPKSKAIIIHIISLIQS